MEYIFLMAGGGTGGHVIPAIVVARELRRRGHHPVFFGTRRGFEARLVPAENFPIEWIQVGALNRVGWGRRIRSLLGLPLVTARVLKWMLRHKPAAVFSMGGYVAGPPMLAAWIAGVPIVVMEPNALPGFTSRKMAGVVRKALVSFPETLAHFPEGVGELAGLPVRNEFFEMPSPTGGEVFTVLVTGGSQGSATLNRASRECWPLLAAAGLRVRFLLQCGAEAEAECKAALEAAGVEGEVTGFIKDMPAAFARAHLVVCRSGAGAVAELAAAGKPSLLVPFPFAADDHQTRNARAMERAGAAQVALDAELNGTKLFEILSALSAAPETLSKMSASARTLAHPGAAVRAADCLEEVAQKAAKRGNRG